MKIVCTFLLVLFLVSCNEEGNPVCMTIKALSGYAPPDNTDPVYNREYMFFYDGSSLVEKEEYSFDDKSLLTRTKYSYSTKGLLVKKIVTSTTSSLEEHVAYEYISSGIIRTTYLISGADTVSSSEYGYFYVENPENKVYHDKSNTYSYKFQNGNLFELGSYEVINDDTVDTFYERYSFDGNISYTKTLALKEIIPNAFESAAISSNNNIIKGEHIGGGWQRSYSFNYNGDQLIRYIDLNTGHTVDFQYECN